ncbi:MAG: methyl-accepting chemotaxis protein [Gammaproteobacteria bacterium]
MSLKKLSNTLDGTNSVVAITLFVLIASLLAMVAVFWYVDKQGDYEREYIAYASEQQVLSQRVAKHALEVSTGSGAGFEQLQRYRDRFDVLLSYEMQGNPAINLPASPAGVTVSLQAMSDVWSSFRENADSVLAGQNTVASVSEIGRVVNEVMPKLQALDESIVDMLISKGASADKIRMATRQLMLSQRIVNNVNHALSGEDVELAIAKFSEDVDEYGMVLAGMMQGNTVAQKVVSEDIQNRLFETSSLFKTITDNVEELLDMSDTLLDIQNAAQNVATQSDTLYNRAGDLKTNYSDLSNKRAINPLLAYLFGAVALMMLLVLAWLMFREQKKRQVEEMLQRQAVEHENKEQQKAIQELLDEITTLADGDLTINATVTENNTTGAIADAINFSVDALRDMVSTINQTSEEVTRAAKASATTVTQLTQASQTQSQEIVSASGSINQMVESISQVSESAAETEKMAKKSVEIARQGGETVKRSITGMDEIRETIQETSKRIKRLGESSQEIGDIVELINDIAEQTNILALNAAIQAAMAGEAGRGFAVVADEVQRLAERSGNATKQIEALVKTIQTDTNEAVISMGHSTAGVVNGAHLAEDAGVALDDIVTVSENLSELIYNISGAAQQQSKAVSGVSETMHVIQEITSQTSEGTTETAASIGHLSELADAMTHSVAGFKLPAAE